MLMITPRIKVSESRILLSTRYKERSLKRRQKFLRKHERFRRMSFLADHVDKIIRTFKRGGRKRVSGHEMDPHAVENTLDFSRQFRQRLIGTAPLQNQGKAPIAILEDVVQKRNAFKAALIDVFQSVISGLFQCHFQCLAAFLQRAVFLIDRHRIVALKVVLNHRLVMIDHSDFFRTDPGKMDENGQRERDH